MCWLIVQYIQKQKIILEKDTRLLLLKRDKTVYETLTSKNQKLLSIFTDCFLVVRMQETKFH